jgi:hypothetical protein
VIFGAQVRTKGKILEQQYKLMQNGKRKIENERS